MKTSLEKEFRVFGETFVHRRTEEPRPPTEEDAKAMVPVEEWSWKPHDPEGAAAVSRHDRFEYTEAIETNYAPDHTRQDIVLVFSYGWGTRALFDALEADDIGYFYCDFDEFTARGKVEVSIEDGGRYLLSLGEAKLDLRDVAAVIWTPPEHMFAEPSTDLGCFLYIHRWRQLLRDLRGLIRKDALWLPSHPLNGSPEWQNKFSELAIAREEGLSVPETICTNDRDAVLAFTKRHPGKVLFREYSRGAPLFPLVFLKEDFGPGDLEHLPAAPCVFQRYVEKAFEFRVVLVGEELFAVRIDSQASEAASIDWRVYDNARVRWDRIDLPSEVGGALRRIAKRLDLAFGSFDLMQGRDGKCYFIELNRPGATYWLLPFVGLDISKEVAAYIARHLRNPAP